MCCLLLAEKKYPNVLIIKRDFAVYTLTPLQIIYKYRILSGINEICAEFFGEQIANAVSTCMTTLFTFHQNYYFFNVLSTRCHDKV